MNKKDMDKLELQLRLSELARKAQQYKNTTDGSYELILHKIEDIKKELESEVSNEIS